MIVGMSLSPDISRDDPAMSQAANEVQALIRLHPEGVTFPELMKAHADRVSVEDAVLASIELLLHEGKISSSETWGAAGRVGFVARAKLSARA